MCVKYHKNVFYKNNVFLEWGGERDKNDRVELINSVVMTQLFVWHMKELL